MNRIISLFLFIFIASCLNGQYNSPIRNKVTLGKQTTADGLVWRGRLADTANLLTNKLDTSVYIVLDTGTRAIWYYSASTTPKWTRLVDSLNNLQGQLSLTTKVTGTLPVANGGTGQNTLALNKVMVGNGTSGVLTPTNLHWDNSNSRLGIGGVPASTNDVDVIKIGSTNVSFALRNDSSSQLFQVNSGFARWLSIDSRVGGKRYDIDNGGFRKGAFRIINNSNNNNVLFIDTSGFLGLSITDPTEKLHVVGNARITAVGALGGNSATLYRNSDGVLSTTSSDINKKHNVRPIIYGLSTINQLNPVNFQWNVDESEDIGFIAQDIQNIIPESIETDWDSNLIFKYEKLIPILTKAIQEQNLLIKALEQRILTLENK